MDGCRLCLNPYAPRPIHPLETPYLKEQLNTVFNFTIDTTYQEDSPSGICQQCSTIVTDFYQFSVQVRANQEQLNVSSLETHIKVEATEFIVTPVDDGDAKEVCKTEPSEDDDDEEPSAKRKRKQSGQTEEPKKVYIKEELSEEDSEDLSDNDDSYESSPEKVEESSDEDDPEPMPTRNKRRSGHIRKSKNDEEDRIKPKAIRNISSKEQIEADFKKISEFFKMLCTDCGVVTEDFFSLNAHHQEIHSRKGFIACCQLKLTKRKKMLEHMQLHENPEAFRCHICNKNYKGRDSLLAHTMNAHSCEEQQVFKCHVCPQTFALKHMLTAHMWKHQEGNECKDCGKMFSSKSNLRAHQIKMHSDIDRRMICDTCGQAFLDKVGFERHVKKHAGIEVVNQLQCHICQKWLRGERRLQIHLQNTHYDQETYTCEICNKQCPSKLALHSHKKTVHVVEKYECEFCGAKFKQSQNLKEHRTIHTGEVLYSCEFCGKSTNSHANFYSHIKKNHPQEWALKKQSKMPKAAAEPAGT